MVTAEPEVRSRDPQDFLLNLTSPLPKKGRRGSSCQLQLQERPSSEVRPFARNPFPNVALLGNVEARVPKTEVRLPAGGGFFVKSTNRKSEV